MDDLVKRQAVLDAFENEGADIYQEWAGEYVEHGFSYNAVQKIIASVPAELKSAGSMKCEAGCQVWVIERDEDGAPCDISGYMFIAEVRGYVIASAYINDLEGIGETLNYHSEETSMNYDTDLAVFPARDCFDLEDTAQKAIEEETKNG